MEIQCILKAVHPALLRGEFKSRKIWLTLAENPEYPQTIEIEVNQAKIDLFNGVSIGAPVTCSVNLRGREWTDPQGVVKVFNTIVCWKVTAGGFIPAKVAEKPLTNPVDLPDLQDDSGSQLPF